MSGRRFKQYFRFDAFKPAFPAVRGERCNDRIRCGLARSRIPVRDGDRVLAWRRDLQDAALEFRTRFDGVRRKCEGARQSKIFGEGCTFAGGSVPPARSQFEPACIGKPMTEYFFGIIRQSTLLLCIAQNYAFLRA